MKTQASVSRRHLISTGMAVGTGLVVGGCLGTSQESPASIYDEYPQTDVDVLAATTETKRGEVQAAISSTPERRRQGLSATDQLRSGWGMLFVYQNEREHSFWMRQMAFGIDIVYAGADGTITSIHHAPAPGPDEDGTEQIYDGTGQYVLEVAYKWTKEHNISEGDRLVFSLPDTVDVTGTGPKDQN